MVRIRNHMCYTILRNEVTYLMKKLYLFLILFSILPLIGCQQKHFDIVTTLFPQYQISKEIVGDNLTVSLLAAPGVDTHHFEPSSKNLVEIINSSLFIYTSNSMEPWIKDIEKGKGIYLNLFNNIKTTNLDILDDVHFFFSIKYQIEMVDIILKEIIAIDGDNKDYYLANATTLKTKLALLSEKFEDLKNQNYYFIGHNVFNSFNQQTKINFIALLDEFTDEVNPSSSELEIMFNNLRDNEIKVLFYDSVTGIKMAENFQTDFGKKSYYITILPIHTFHTVNKDIFNNLSSIADLWEINYLNLKEGIQ